MKYLSALLCLLVPLGTTTIYSMNCFGGKPKKSTPLPPKTPPTSEKRINKVTSQIQDLKPYKLEILEKLVAKDEHQQMLCSLFPDHLHKQAIIKLIKNGAAQEKIFHEGKKQEYRNSAQKSLVRTFSAIKFFSDNQEDLCDIAAEIKTRDTDLQKLLTVFQKNIHDHEQKIFNEHYTLAAACKIKELYEATKKSDSLEKIKAIFFSDTSTTTKSEKAEGRYKATLDFIKNAHLCMLACEMDNQKLIAKETIQDTFSALTRYEDEILSIRKALSL